MPFNLNSVPAEGRTAEQIKMHIDLYNRSQDICLIHNPGDQDFTFFYNRKFEPNPYVVPNKNRDIGFGPGNLEIRRFLANIYIEKMGEQMINAISKADWDSKKGNYRQEEQGIMEERLAIRTNNKTLWAKIVPQLFLGIVRRSTEELGTETFVPDAPVDNTLSNAEQIMQQLGLNDKEVSLASESQSQELSEEDKRKADLLASIV